MKTLFKTTIKSAAVLAALALISTAKVQAQVFLNDTFSDNERVTQTLPNTAQWSFRTANSGNPTIDASSGAMITTPITTASAGYTFLSYFRDGTSTANLVNVGDSITVSFKLNPQALAQGSASGGRHRWRFGLWDTHLATRLSGDVAGSSTATVFDNATPGYFIDVNHDGSSVNNNLSFTTYSRSTTYTSGATILGSLSSPQNTKFTEVNAGTTPSSVNTYLTAGSANTIKLTLTKTGATSINVKITLNGTTWDLATDASAVTFNFNTFLMTTFSETTTPFVHVFGTSQTWDDFNVSVSNTTTTVASSLNPSTSGNSVTFTATVQTNGAPGTATSATGSVVFYDGATALSTNTVSSGVATYITSALAAGSHSITAVYLGDTSYGTSSSSALSQTVNAPITHTTTTSLSSSLNPSTNGDSVTFTATVNTNSPTSIATAATGTVTFKDGVSALGTGTLSSGVATYSTSSLSVGSHSIIAVYGGDSGYLTSTSSILTQVVNPVPTTISVYDGFNYPSGSSLSANTGSGTGLSGNWSADFSAGTAVTTVVTNGLSFGSGSSSLVTSGNAAQVTIVNNNTTGDDRAWVTRSISASVGATAFQSYLFKVNTRGGSFNMAGTAIGMGNQTTTDADIKLLGLEYGADACAAGFTGGGESQFGSVSAGTTYMLIASYSGLGSSASGTAWLLTSAQFDAFKAAGGDVAALNANNSGTTSFANPGGSQTISGSALLGGYVAPFGAATTFTVDELRYGNTLAAVTPTAIATTVVLTSSLNPSTTGQSVTFTATVSSSSATGSVVFYDGATPLHTNTLTSGVASYATSSLSDGVHSITASYLGDNVYNSSVSTVLSQTVTTPLAVASTVALASSMNPSTNGDSVTFTATVKTNGVTAIATSGLVTFKDGATTLGTGSVGSGVATFATSTLTVGSHSITAVYSGDANFLTSTSSVLTQVVNELNIVYAFEDFNYSLGSSLNGQNGGTGFSTAWSLYGGTAVITNGLTCGSLTVSGNAVQYTTPGDTGGWDYFGSAQRSKSGSFGSTFYQSHLARVDVSGDGATMLGVGSATAGSGNSVSDGLFVKDYYSDGPAIGGAPGSTSFGSALTAGTTYLLVGKYTSSSTKMWVLDAAGYNTWLSGAKTEATLDAAALMSGTRGSGTAMGDVTIGCYRYSATTSSFTVADLRFGSSLAAVLPGTAVVAPATNSVSVSGSTATITVHGNPNATYVLLTTTNLAGVWVPIQTNTASPAGLLNFTDSNATNRQQFYRTAQ